MPVNRNALIRYKTIDQCLQNRYRRWTLEQLIDACSEALYEYEGISKGVSRRTVQADIQIMRSDKLGYNAPIVVVEKKYYTYEDPDYSITNVPISGQDLGRLQEAVEFLKQFQGFSHFRELDGMVQKLEGHVYAQKTKQRPVIDFERNENLKGLEYLDPLYRAIIRKLVVEVDYRSFRAREANTLVFHPYLLKEFNNRWFVLGKKQGQSKLLILALDRIESLSPPSGATFTELPGFDPAEYFKDVIGVTVNEGNRPRNIRIWVDRQNAPYVLTKPLHSSQEVIEERQDGVVVNIRVKHNFELERRILGFGPAMEVLQPARLRRQIRAQLERAFRRYEARDEKGSLDKP
ncbi:MAG: WYL domain-containing protein [Phaeodactylibacter sp.]|nr:WYL domain-containing protein [Phaeodactylibacter sp.]MCB9050910.1 WYL domain-containing protein [Lewinellaceae bacterium]